MKRPLTAVLLVVGILACLLLLFQDRIFAGDFDAVAESQLATRATQYQDLRKADDWVKIYEMVDPDQRRTVDLAQFMGVFGTGILRMHSFETVSSGIDRNKRVARTVMKCSGELVLEKLPANYRRSLQGTSKSELKRDTELTLDWVWRDGKWFFVLEREVMTNRDAKGNQLKPVKGSGKQDGSGK